MKLHDVLPNVNPSGDGKVCHDVEPMAAGIGLYMLCDRTPRHTGKHQYHMRDGGLVQWWKAPARITVDTP